MKLFHYTDRRGYDGIVRDGRIEAAKNGKFGEYVYLTDLDPEKHNRAYVAQENYHGGAARNLEAGRLDHHFAFDLPNDSVQWVRDHVYIYTESDGALHLSRHEVLSHGDDNAWKMAAGLLAMATVATVANMAWSSWRESSRSASQQRQKGVKDNLQKLLVNGYSSCIVTEQQGGLCIYCNQCEERVTDVYYFGFMSYSVNEDKVKEQLLNHYRGSHLVPKVEMVIILVCAGAAFLKLLFYAAATLAPIFK